MIPLAHSANARRGIPAQPYSEHVSEVLRRAEEHAERAARYSTLRGAALTHAVRLAAEYHDLGKLDAENQQVLSSGSSREPLPLNHVDAGVAWLIRTHCRNGLAPAIVHAHHCGLPDFPDELASPSAFLRDRKSRIAGRPLRDMTEERLDDYIRIHRLAYPQTGGYLRDRTEPPPKDPVLFRIGLSCLVDADHSDTARHYNGFWASDGPSLRPVERLELMDAHVRVLEQDRQDERAQLRSAIYRSCRSADTRASVLACDAPVGSGKTTAIMAHLLQAAIEKDLRRVFVVLPFTNIIDQSVGVYRRALVASGESPTDVVAAHHHRAEFADLESRQFAFLWHAPIVVTTAVQFFETLASNHPAALRKLHQVPGSAIFIDEADAALPPHLWPQAWKWLNKLAGEWGCHLVLGSGSLSRFWELEEFSQPAARIPELVRENVRASAFVQDSQRITYRTCRAPLALAQLVQWLPELPGPRLLILNTVQSAAVVADAIVDTFGRERVEHLSTSLCPPDRKQTLGRIKERLHSSGEKEWTLVATSCVECGVDLSFRTGLRERCSLSSLIQIGGRINREGEYAGSLVWDFQLLPDRLLSQHPAFEVSGRILGQLFDKRRIGPQYVTEAMKLEVRHAGLRDASAQILAAEKNLKFPTVADTFKVIDQDTITVVVDEATIERVEQGETVDPEVIQANSVQIWKGRRELQGATRPIDSSPGLLAWNLTYDGFIGYMAGVLPLLKAQVSGLASV